MHMVEATQTDRNRSVCQFKKADLEPTWNRPGTHSQWLKLTLGTGPKEIILFRGVSFLTLKRHLNFHGKQLKKKKTRDISDVQTIAKASCLQPIMIAREGFFTRAKRFRFLRAIKMKICRYQQQYNSVICKLVSICCEHKINKAYDLH